MSRRVFLKLTVPLAVFTMISAFMVTPALATLELETVTTWYWTGDTGISSVFVGDVDADGSVEIVTGGSYNDGTRNNAQLCVWNGSTLMLENVRTWSWTANTFISSVAVDDVDGDGSVEIVTGGSYNDGTRSNAQLCVWSGSTLVLEEVAVWYWTGDTRIYSVAVGDVDGDGSVEIVTGGDYDDGSRAVAQLCVWDGSTLALESVTTWYWIASTWINSVSIGNVDGDGSVEIVTGGNHYTGTDEWAVKMAQLCVWDGSSLALEDVKTWCWADRTSISSVAVGDVDADGSVEIVTGGNYRGAAQLALWIKT